jgi:hypothetical protein
LFGRYLSFNMIKRHQQKSDLAILPWRWAPIIDNFNNEQYIYMYIDILDGNHHYYIFYIFKVLVYNTYIYLPEYHFYIYIALPLTLNDCICPLTPSSPAPGAVNETNSIFGRRLSGAGGGGRFRKNDWIMEYKGDRIGSHICLNCIYDICMYIYIYLWSYIHSCIYAFIYLWFIWNRDVQGDAPQSSCVCRFATNLFYLF